MDRNKSLHVLLAVTPTVVSHVVMVVGLCADDPKDFWNLEGRS